MVQGQVDALVVSQPEVAPSRPPVLPAAATPRPGFSAVAETRHGILQYRPDDGDVGKALGWYGEWREGELELLASWIRPGSWVLEVDAGVGAHAVPLSTMLARVGICSCTSRVRCGNGSCGRISRPIAWRM